ncbi:FecR domain-containing protein [Massilia sp. HP4]|uniref:FecR family protein n=1 Tax=Massilia sp. HP4 TaxID=2562316 RepID=UPI001E2C61A2|nr:FecR family protein [Massilia sp. HP4]
MASAVQAAEAGKVIFVAGAAQVVDRKAAEGDAVQEGELLQTGADGFIYVKTSDNGLFILRPNTKARIVAYHIDKANPENTRVKLELISGVARSKSGDEVKRARQNFRFNTPVAAIGVRGTDFTVFTDDTTSRVTVLTGGVVVSGFGDACRPDGGGPCEGARSRELSATQRGQLLQIQQGATAPQLLNGTSVVPEAQVLPIGVPMVMAPGRNAVVTPVEMSVDIRKGDKVVDNVNNQVPRPDPGQPLPGNPNPPQPEPQPPVVTPIDPVPPTPVRHAGIKWGRWERVTGPAPDFDLTQEMTKNQLVAVKGNFAVLRTPGQEYVVPERGGMGFRLADSEAYIYTSYGSSYSAAAATLSNGKLEVDFGKRSFETSFDLSRKDEKYSFRAGGVLGADGTLYGDRAEGRAGYMNVQGLLSNDKGGGAAYIFDGRIDDRRTVNGGTSWTPITR